MPGCLAACFISDFIGRHLAAKGILMHIVHRNVKNLRPSLLSIDLHLLQAPGCMAESNGFGGNRTESACTRISEEILRWAFREC